METETVSAEAQELNTMTGTPRRSRPASIARRFVLLIAGLALPFALLLASTGSASAATIGGDYYATPGSCQIISSTPYGLSWQQQLEGVGTVTSYLNLNYPLPTEVQRVAGTTKVVWRANLYVLANNTWVKVQSESVHTVTGPWIAVNSSWMGGLNWDSAGRAYYGEALSLPVGHRYFMAAETWWVNSSGATLAYSNNWTTGCNS